MGLSRVVCLLIVYILRVSSQDYPCDCVPYYLCDVNGFIITDGSGNINDRLGRVRCDDPIATCCKVPPPFTNQPPDNPSTPPAEPDTPPYKPPYNPNTPIPQPNPYPGPVNPEPESSTLTAFPFPSEDDPTPLDTCGVLQKQRIVQGNTGETSSAEVPWMVALLVETPQLVFNCGGSLITQSIVLTAAHCFKKLKVNVSSLIAVAGKIDSQSIQSPIEHQERRVERIILHPNYNPNNSFYDIALISTVAPFNITQNVKTICLPETLVPDSRFDNARCIVSGWGKDTFNGGQGMPFQYPTKLKVIEVPKLPMNQCEALLRQTRVGKYFLLHESFVCAGGELGKDACQGDGGGPLVCPNPRWEGENRWVQIGIVSWGIDCGNKSVPGVYTNVPLLTRWIYEQIYKLEPKVTA